MTKTVLAVDVERTQIVAAIIDGEGKVLERKAAALDQTSRVAPVKQIAGLAEELGRTHRFGMAGISVPGIIGRDGAVCAPYVHGWEHISLERLLEERLGVSAAVESARATAVLGEVFAPRGAAHGKENVVALMVGHEISAGILLDGKLVRGAHDLAGSAGWMAVTLADCLEVRQYGCLEAYASGPGVVRTAQATIEAGFGAGMTKIGADRITAHDVAELARNGDVSAKEIFRRVGKLLGLAAANLISLFDPEVIVLGGELARAGDICWEEIRQTALERCEPLAAKKVKLVLSKLGDDAHLMGAAKLAWDAEHSRARAARAKISVIRAGHRSAGHD